MAIQRVYVRLGGGLGDVVQNLLSTEVADIQEPGYLNIDIPPASVPASSRWFCRLKDFKKKHPGVCVIAACMCHNPGAKDLFEYNPLVDEVKMIHWVMPKDMVDNVFEDATDAVDINSLFDYKDYEKDSNDRIFLSNAEKLPAIAFCQIMPYIVIHPFAGHKGRELYPLDLYADVIDKLIDEYGYRVLLLGKATRQAWRISIPTRETRVLAIQDTGFITWSIDIVPH